MQRVRGQHHDRGAFLAVAAAALTAQLGAAMVGIGYSYGNPGPPAPRPGSGAAASAAAAAEPAEAVPASAASPAATALDGSPVLGYSIPVRLSISRLGIDTGLMTLGMLPDRTVEVPPADADAPAGWYRNLASPGEAGSAVILGHVDSPQGRAVFYPLGMSRPGDRVLVRRADGHTAAYTVDRVASYPREQFPTEAVYGQAGPPGLRLVTCGGEYDRDAGGYQENVIVFATLASTS